MTEKSNIDYIMRSLLQKAVRRGDNDLTEKIVIYLLNNNDLEWVRRRLASITFEEAWSYGMQVNYERNPQILINHYLHLSSMVKNKEANGLGSLAYDFFSGNKAFLNFLDKDDFRHIKIVSEGIKRPNDFWDWAIKTVNNNHRKSTFINNAFDSFKKVSWLCDKAFIIAAAYLAINNDIPEIIPSKIMLVTPYWVGIDKHTQPGKQIIKKVAYEMNIDVEKALCLSFYFEGALCNQIQSNFWWNKEVSLKIQNLGLSLEQAQEIWNKLKIRVSHLLTEESLKVEQALENIKLSDKFDTKEQLGLF